jgi:hypothetical protein
MVAGLDSWQAMELDVALAVKYDTLEKERDNNKLDVLLAAIDNLLRAQGAKVKKRKAQKSLIGPYRDPDAKAEDDLPLVDDIIAQLTGGRTVVHMEGIGKK